MDGTGKTAETETGSVYGSFLFLYLVSAPAAMALFGLLVALRSQSGRPVIPALIGIAVGMGILCAIFRRTTTVSVYGAGFSLQSLALSVDVKWDDVVSVEAHRFSGKLILREPIRLGLAKRRKLTFACFDPHWHDRPTSKVILARTQRILDASGGSGEGP